jgi:beta-phosphoglucomutase family hydrolase
LTTPPCDAVIFDLDGVITDTARVHARAWKTLFDDFIADWALAHDQAPTVFELHADYLRYIDGKSRYDGVQSFLQSRDVRLPYGREDDSGERQTVCGLGNRKDAIFLSLLATDGVPVFDSSTPCIARLSAQFIRCAVVSSSRNCRRVLRAAGLEHMFESTLDGTDIVALGLKGKPHPDLFLKCAENLACAPRRCVVLEDSISGVEAARLGGFGLVVGVDRTGIGDQLTARGAHVLVSDLSELSVDRIATWFDGARA